MQSGGMEQRHVASQKPDQLGAELATVILIGAYKVSHLVEQEHFAWLLLSDRDAPFVIESHTIGPAREITLQEERIVNPFVIGDCRQPGRGLGERQSLCRHLALKGVLDGISLLRFSGFSHVIQTQSHAGLHPPHYVQQ